MKLLAGSANKSEVKWAVMMRLVISRYNSLLEQMDSVSRGVLAPFTYEELNKLFKEFEEFRSKKGFADHMQAWYMGEDVSQFEGDVGEELTGGDGGAPQAEEEYPEGATIFGGDYVADAEEDGEAEGSEEAEVPEMQGPDDDGPGPEEPGEVYPEVPQV